ncbi:MAG: hypothetical protein ABSB40_03195 [Nitrososphaeria archaeon]
MNSMMSRGPYEPPIKKFVKCLEGSLEKDKEYTINQVGEVCNLDPRTVQVYVYRDLEETNKWMTPPKNVKQKEFCRCYKGLVVDPPENTDLLAFGIFAFGLIFTGLIYGCTNPQ